MGFTITSSTFGISTTTLTATVYGTGANSFLLETVYTKGNEDTITYSISYIDDRISTSTAFKAAVKDTATVAQKVFTQTGTSNYAIPFSIPPGITHVVVDVGSSGATPTGTVVINGFPVVE